MITDLLESNGIQTAGSSHHHVRSGWVGIDCPYCSPGSSSYRMGIEIGTGRVNCWVCGIKWGPNVLAEIMRISPAKAKRLWFHEYQDRHLHIADRDEVEHELVLPKGIRTMMAAHRRYLQNKRGLDPDEISRLWGVQGIGLSSELSWCLFIPLFDERGRMVSWTTRSLSDVGLRYISAGEDQAELNLKTLLYGEHLARSTAVFVEGPIDAWKIGPGACATLGVAYTQIQLSRMAKFSNRVVCFDSTDDAQERADALCRDLSALPGSTVNVCLETGDDPGDADDAEIAELRAKYLEFG